MRLAFDTPARMGIFGCAGTAGRRSFRGEDSRTCLQKRTAAQVLQPEDCPVEDWYWPELHVMQLAFPAVFWYCPTGHSVQAAPTA